MGVLVTLAAIYGGLMACGILHEIWRRIMLGKPTIFERPTNKQIEEAERRLEQALKRTYRGKRVAVIGCGNVGSTIIRLLHQRGERDIVAADIVEPAVAKELDGVTFVRCDVTKPESIAEVVKGCESVFYTVALILYHQRLDCQYALSHRVNVQGTENALDVCLQQGVKNFVYCSTSHVAIGFDHTKDVRETDGYTQAPFSHYSTTKILAEKLVLQADGPNMKTVAVRPCSGIFGPHDRLIVERPMVKRDLKHLGPEAEIDYVFVENVAYAHILAEAGLINDRPGVAGEAFNITNGERPVRAYDLFATEVEWAKPEIEIAVGHAPRFVMWSIAHTVEFIQKITGGKSPTGEIAMVTPSMLYTALSTNNFKGDKAKKFLGYEPMYTFEEGLSKSVEILKKKIASAEKTN